MVAPVARVLRRLPPLREVVNQRRVAVVGGLDILRRGRLGVSVIDPEIGSRSGLQVRDSYPQQRLAKKRIEFFQVVFEWRLVVGSDDPQIAAVLLERLELEVASVQPDQHSSRPDRLGHAGGSGVY